MSYYSDEYDLERSHELERRLDRDGEREPFSVRRSRRHRRPLLSLSVVEEPALPEMKEAA